jgi:hypothetical protein
MGTQDVDLARKSAECYLKAAGQLPEDDEDHACKIVCILILIWCSNNTHH